MMKLFFIPLLMLTVTAISQDQTDRSDEELSPPPVPVESEIEVTEGTEPNAEASNSTEAAAGRDFDVFLPTEDISEDLAVPFPADI